VAKSYEVVIANNREQAEATARAQKPDMVVLGTIMPRGDAFLFHRRLRQSPQSGDVPTLVIDARSEEQLTKGWRKNEGLQCEAEEFISKPVEVAMLLPRIEKLVDRVTERIKVLIADDHGMVRDGIRAVVNGREALEKTAKLSPDVVLMDIVMPVMNGLDATRQICRECPHSKVLMLSQYDDEENILASRQVGALGFISKAAVSSQLLTGIRSVSQGEQFTRVSVN
jgi:DNA-binding NarL/FixJ family response regulator